MQLISMLLFFILQNIACAWSLNGQGFKNSTDSRVKMYEEFKLAEDVESCLLNHRFAANQIVLRDRPTTRGAYLVLNHQWNMYYEYKEPMMYVLPKTSHQVQETVYCARSYNTRVVPKCGGHSYAKYAYGDHKSLIFDFQNFANVSIDTTANTANVDPGMLLGPLAWKLIDKNYTLSIGTCHSVGIATTLGGGYPRVPRTYGMIVDYLTEVDIVTPSAEILTANNVYFKDLFWAVRGGGAGAAFGIVTRYKFQFPPPTVLPNVVSAFRYYKLNQIPEILSAYMKLTAYNPPNEISCGLEIHTDQVRVSVYEVIWPNRVNDFGTQDALSLFPSGAFNSSTKVEDYAAFLDIRNSPFFNPNDADDPRTNKHFYDGPSAHKVKAFISEKILDDEDVQKLSELIMEIPDIVFIDFLPFGGAISNFKPSDMALVHRNPGSYKVSIHLFQLSLPFEGACYGESFVHLQMQSDEPVCRPHALDSTKVTKGLDFLHKLYNMTLDLMHHNASYQNDVDEELDNPLPRFFGANLKRLVKIKKKFDPENYFYNPESIPPVFGTIVVNGE